MEKTNNTVPSSFERRLADLERQVAELRTLLANGNRPKDWRRTVGMFTGDEVMKRIDEYARQYRERDRAKARRQAKRRKA